MNTQENSTSTGWRQIKLPQYSVNNLLSMEDIELAAYVFFAEAEQGEINASCMNMKYIAPFDVGEDHYVSAEHYYLAEKAKIAGDFKSRELIKKATEPAEFRMLEREIENLNPVTWDEVKYAIALVGNYHKFWNNMALKKYLMTTEQKILAYTDSEDLIWGTGLDIDHEDAEDPSKWPGQNLLGFAIMELRDHLRKFQKR